MVSSDSLIEKPLALDLFSGSGGLTVGLKLAGFKVIGAVELNSAAAETYQLNHKEIELWQRDIRELSVEEVKEKLNLKFGELDLLAGCPPCQGFSSIRTYNRSNSVDDPRNNLIFDFLRFVQGLRPRVIMLENVPGLVKDKRLSIFCESLQEMGYSVNYAVLDAAKYGVPQRRRRMILFAGRYGDLQVTHPQCTRQTVREAIGNLPLPGTSGDVLHDYPEKRSEKVMNLIAKIPKDGGSRRDLGDEMQLDCHKKCKGFNDVYGRMRWDDVAPTITGGCTNPSKGRFIHPEQNRAITLREAALLQSFPPSYQFSLKGGKSAISLMIGNALPPEFIRQHALLVREYLKKNREMENV